MRLTLTILCLLCLGAMPPVPKVYKPARGVTQGAGAALLISKGIIPPQTRTNVFAWRYSPGATNYYWSLQYSTNLHDWTTVLTNCTGTIDVVAPKTGKGFWRLKGTR